MLRRMAAAGSLAALSMLSVAPAFASAPHATVAATKPPKCPKGHGNGNGNGYPPGQCKATVDHSTVQQGGEVTVTGDGFNPGENVDFTLHSSPIHLATVPAAATTVASATLTIPASTPAGTHTIVIDGLSSGNELSVSINVTVAGRSTSASGLPFTGAAAAIPLTGAGAAMVIAGGLTLMAVRRRRRPVTR
jgi:hypothetical protein